MLAGDLGARALVVALRARRAAARDRPAREDVQPGRAAGAKAPTDPRHTAPPRSTRGATTQLPTLGPTARTPAHTGRARR